MAGPIVDAINRASGFEDVGNVGGQAGVEGYGVVPDSLLGWGEWRMRLGGAVEERVRIFARRGMFGRIAPGFGLLIEHVVEIEPEAAVKLENWQRTEDGIALRARNGD